MNTAAVPISTFDDEIFALNLQLDELKIHQDADRGKYRARHAPDLEVAMSTFQSEIQGYIALLGDIILAHSLSSAVSKDGTAIAEIVDEEVREGRDRRMALALSGHNDHQDAPPSYGESSGSQLAVFPSETGTVGDVLTYEAIQEQLFESLFDGQEESSSSGAALEHTDQQQQALQKLLEHTATCVACNDKFQHHKTIRVVCGHRYCRNCLKELFLHTIKEITLFPPRCCRREISLEIISTILSADEFEEFEHAQTEFSTHNKTYCSSPDCGRFILPANIVGDRARCVSCDEATCVHCKGVFHDGHCPEDHALQTTLALAKENNWARCHSCRTVVELAIGCNHITCKCGAEFCYECNAPWKNCLCAIYQERHLLVRVEEIVDREAEQPLPAVERDRRMVQVRQQLLDQDECEHPGRFERIFNYGRRGVRCEMCEARHWKYILRCRRCHLEVCEDCRRHRVR